MRAGRVVCLAAAALAACSSAPPVRALSADEAGVSFDFAAGRQDEAGQQAALYCANLGRDAALKTLTPEKDGRAVATYECR